MSDCIHDPIFEGSVIVCRRCGAEFPMLSPPSGGASTSWPVHRIDPRGRGLGTRTTHSLCRSVLSSGLKAEGKNPVEVNRRAYRLYRESEPKTDPLTTGVLSDVWEYLKKRMPPDVMGDYAASLAIREIKRFRADYPDLNPHGLKDQLVKRVIVQIDTALTHPLLEVEAD
ncbi:MAG: hypothetical protein ABSF83_09230 [Nitrososphaerales archaeon]|jgi:hypothetical protein